jgi:predicted PurR-regulated permease PerM
MSTLTLIFDVIAVLSIIVAFWVLYPNKASESANTRNLIKNIQVTTEQHISNNVALLKQISEIKERIVRVGEERPEIANRFSNSLEHLSKSEELLKQSINQLKDMNKLSKI